MSADPTPPPVPAPVQGSQNSAQNSVPAVADAGDLLIAIAAANRAVREDPQLLPQGVAAESGWLLGYAAGVAAGEARGRTASAAAIRAEAAQLEERDGVVISYAYGFADAADFIDPPAARIAEGNRTDG